MGWSSRTGPPKSGLTSELEWRPAASTYTALLEIITVERASRASGSSAAASAAVKQAQSTSRSAPSPNTARMAPASSRSTAVNRPPAAAMPRGIRAGSRPVSSTDQPAASSRRAAARPIAPVPPMMTARATPPPYPPSSPDPARPVPTPPLA